MRAGPLSLWLFVVSVASNLLALALPLALLQVCGDASPHDAGVHEQPPADVPAPEPPPDMAHHHG